MITFLNPPKILQSALQSVVHSVAVYDVHPYIRSSSLTSAFCPAQTWRSSRSLGRQSCRVLAGFSRRYLVLEDHAEQLPSQPVGQPRVLDDGHLEAFAAQHGVVVGVNGSAHALDDHQVGLSLPHHHGQHFIQTAGETEFILLCINFTRGTILFSKCQHQTLKITVTLFLQQIITIQNKQVSTAGPVCTLL